MAAIDSAYQYYLSTYGNSTVSRYDTHKKSQLRDTYNKIVKTNLMLFVKYWLFFVYCASIFDRVTFSVTLSFFLFPP